MRTSAAVLTALGLLVLPGAAAAQEGEAEVKPAGKETITIGGFVSTTLFLQDQRFGFTNGQAAEWAAAQEFAEDEWFFGGDVRNTRLQLGFDGPELGAGWRAAAILEMDFFGGFNGAGPFSDEQPTPRLRLAYADLIREGTRIRIGQAWSPLFGNVPVSLSHLAFPLGYGSAGMVGWRFPGVWLFQQLSGEDSPVDIGLQVAAMRGSWVGLPGEVVDNLSPGEAAVIPQLEARLDFGGRLGETPWGAYVVGHYDRKDLSGVGRTFPNEEDDELTGTAFEVGASLRPGPLTLQGNLYFGQSIGQQFGHITQFGDISGWGAWGQAGYALTPRWSVWAFYGTADPEDDDVRGALISPFTPTTANPGRDARLQNRLTQTMLRYSMGQYALGVEWIRANTDWVSRALIAGVPTDRQFDRSANQIAFSIFYGF